MKYSSELFDNQYLNLSDSESDSYFRIPILLIMCQFLLLIFLLIYLIIYLKAFS